MAEQLQQERKQAGITEPPTLQDMIDYVLHTTINAVETGERWMLLLQLADMAKKENEFETARGLFHSAVKAQPTSCQGWLDYAKMEEECGDLQHCQSLLLRGVKACQPFPNNEVLLVRAIKLEERLNNIPAAHKLLSTHLSNTPLEKSWRVLLEGAMLDARVGHWDVARKVFDFLLKHVPWYGPIYHQYSLFEERCEEFDKAINVIEKGLKEIPRYGPLWFSAIRLYEKLPKHHSKLPAALERASEVLLKDLKWKVFFEWAQVEDRAGNLAQSRAAYVHAAALCPENLEWKVWHAGSRTEAVAGNWKAARALMSRALVTVPAKMRPVVLLEQARLEEFAGCVDVAREVLDEAKVSAKHEWKVFLERVLLEVRAGNFEAAVREVHESLLVHSGTGRLWAILLQLWTRFGIEAQRLLFKRALQEVPKSGEVWCEGARNYIKRRKWGKARTCLIFAAQFTPQYGDTFIEYLRCELLETGHFSDPCPIEQQCINADPNYGPLWLHCKRNVLDSPKQVLRNARQMLYDALALKRDNVFAAWLMDVNIMYAVTHKMPTLLAQFKMIYGSDQIKP